MLRMWVELRLILFMKLLISMMGRLGCKVSIWWMILRLVIFGMVRLVMSRVMVVGFCLKLVSVVGVL